MSTARPIALVTGASGDIGGAIAQVLGSHGWHVIGTYVGAADAAAATVTTITDAGGSAEAMQLDQRDPDAIEALIEREGLGPTGVGHGIALPHARLAEVDTVRGIFIRLEKPLNFDAVDRQPVDLVFALLAPKTQGVDHLKALALVSRTMRDPDICAKLRANSDPSTIHTILTEQQVHQAA